MNKLFDTVLKEASPSSNGRKLTLVLPQGRDVYTSAELVRKAIDFAFQDFECDTFKMGEDFCDVVMPDYIDYEDLEGDDFEDDNFDGDDFEAE